MQRVLALGGARRAAGAAGGGETRRLSGAVVSARIALRQDERLARRVAAGSRGAVAALSERYCEQLYAYCYLLLHDTDLAYDTLQATLARAVKALRLGGGQGFLRPWLFRIARDEVTALLREKALARRPARHLPMPPGGSQGSVEERARLAMLAGDLHALPELQCSALLMRELSGLSHREIAAALEIAPPSVKQAIFHARRALAELEQGRSLACEEVRRTISHGDGRKLRSRTVSAHLRSCSACATFAAAIPSRSGDLQALVPPLAPTLAAGLLTHLLVGSTARPAGRLLSGLAGKSTGAGLAGKTALATAIAATAAGGGLAVGAIVQPHSRALRARGGAPFGVARQTQAPGGAAHRQLTERSAPAHRRASPAPGHGIAADLPQPAGATHDFRAHGARGADAPRAIPATAISGSQAFVVKRTSQAPAAVPVPIRPIETPTHGGRATRTRSLDGGRVSHPGGGRSSHPRGTRSSHPRGTRSQRHERERGGLPGDRPRHGGQDEGRDSRVARRAGESDPGMRWRAGEPAARGLRVATRAYAPRRSNVPPAAGAAPGAIPAAGATTPAVPDHAASSQAAQPPTAPRASTSVGSQTSPVRPASHDARAEAEPPRASMPSA